MYYKVLKLTTKRMEIEPIESKKKKKKQNGRKKTELNQWKEGMQNKR